MAGLLKWLLWLDQFLLIHTHTHIQLYGRELWLEVPPTTLVNIHVSLYIWHGVAQWPSMISSPHASPTKSGAYTVNCHFLCVSRWFLYPPGRAVYSKTHPLKWYTTSYTRLVGGDKVIKYLVPCVCSLSGGALYKVAYQCNEEKVRQ